MYIINVIDIFVIIMMIANADYPGPPHLHPKIHYSPECLHQGGWHDIAGALTWEGTHHVFQGCPGSGGWHHGASVDLVHWEDRGIGPRAIHETHAGMDSNDSPCSGFVTVDDDGAVCSGFRQCGSSKGVHGGKPWDVPLELRCATNSNLTEWSEPIYLFDIFFYRAIPYDPARPWKDFDGNWYQIVSTDACNDTTRKSPCAAGGRLDMWKSPKLHGTGAKWEYIGHIFTSNRTVLKGGHLTKEMVTIDYLGGMPGDPMGGKTRVFFNNVGGNGGGEGCCSGTTGYFVGKQVNGSPFQVDFSKSYAMGMVDWGSFSPDGEGFGIDSLSGTSSRGYSMARSLGGMPNQVTENGRRVMVAWTGGTPGSMSIPRDLSLDKNFNLLQQFVPEMKQLRKKNVLEGQQVEILAHFFIPGGAHPIVDNGWKIVLAKGSYGKIDVGQATFNEHFLNSPTKIVKRVCKQCVNVYKVVYYKRLTPLKNLDLYDTLKSNWSDVIANTLNIDFEIYNNYNDALAGVNRWTYCNYDDYSGVGAFRDCGPTGGISDQWNSWSGRGGQVDVAFYIDIGQHPPTPQPFGIKVLGATDSKEKTLIGIDPQHGLFYIDGTAQGNGQVRAGPLYPPNATKIDVHAIIDHSIIEVIFNNRTAFTVYVTPSSNASTKISLFGIDDPSIGANLKVWELASANNV